ncbi:cell wall hydrolase autolysin [Leptolyngbya sp. Heron Island J]|nr:cell wall hydrolase autolysin [Leptolyngbya sp. Heron Island J]
MRRRGKQWGGFILTLMAVLMLASPAQAQRTRVIQAPAPYNACNLRSAGGIQYRVVGTFRNGVAVTLLGESGRGWYRVQVGEEIGWMARQCLGL